jgi:peptidyl-prolyl cis-trans isomerase C
MSDEQKNQMKEKIIDDLVTEEVLFQEAREQNIEVDKSEIDSQLQQVKEGYQDQATFQEDLQKGGFTEETFRNYVKRNLMIGKLVDQQMQGNITVTQQEMKEFYENNTQYFEQPEKVSASHILIKVEEGATEEEQQAALEKARSLKQQLEDGADFAELAREESQGPSSENGGSLGSFSRGQMVPAFEKAAFNLNKGEISDVVQTQFGYHIIKVTDKKEPETQPFEQAQPNIEQYLMRNKQMEFYSSYVAKLKEKAEIETFAMDG